MKNKKTIVGTILLLFAISGICNVVNVSAFTDTIDIPPLSYAYYSLGYLDVGDKLLINEIDSDGEIDVLLMNEEQFDDYEGYSWSCEHSWIDIVYLADWVFQIYESGDYYYIVLINKAVFTTKTVYVDISFDRYVDNTIEDTIDIRPIMALIIAIGVIFGVVVLRVLSVKKSKKKKREAVAQYQEIKPESYFCSNCGAENRDITNEYCSKCGSRIVR